MLSSCSSAENLGRVIAGLSGLEDGAARELAPRDLLENVVVKVADEVEVDIRTKAWKVAYADALPEAKETVIDGVRIPFLGLDALIASKETYREQDASKLIELVEYFDRDVALMPKRELLLAFRFYDLKLKDPFFRGVQRNAACLLRTINSMSWDLAHWRNIMMLLTAAGALRMGGHFPISYFLTCDRSLAALLQKLQLVGVIYCGKTYLPIYDRRTERALTSGLAGAAHLLTARAIAERQDRQPTDEALTAHLERVAEAAGNELLRVTRSHSG